ncbi:uncharacterized protein LY79DRAFT_583665 [Colletotrichum navitas]|uniref:Ketoreductase domain-containing protein n=1 Tax=Colletotrichum navitas TaxID=681940 RepID=A0AAD8PPC5_9PEZI|nr:uncharacterized protein LY79DRAFT_583665 [Colletotrichum navitas]KAK1573456.1 hypothetical protein LY79DRAFT_583665 [Colletotrichum navitas]
MLGESFRILADGGIMVEIGKKDILDRNSLPLAPFDRSLSFRAVDLSPERTTDALISRLFPKVFQLFEGGHKPINPIHTHPFRDNGSYLIVGGLRGLCGSLAMCLAKSGARHLAVFSRSGAQWSSVISGVVGNRGQANCAAANVFLDNFAAHRRNRGQTACAVDLDVIEDSGVIAENAQLQNQFDSSVYKGINDAHLRKILHLSLLQQQEAPERVGRSCGQAENDGGGGQRMFREVAAAVRADGPGAPAVGLRNRLAGGGGGKITPKWLTGRNSMASEHPLTRLEIAETQETGARLG